MMEFTAPRFEEGAYLGRFPVEIVRPLAFEDAFQPRSLSMRSSDMPGGRAPMSARNASKPSAPSQRLQTVMPRSRYPGTVELAPQRCSMALYEP